MTTAKKMIVLWIGGSRAMLSANTTRMDLASHMLPWMSTYLSQIHRLVVLDLKGLEGGR